MSGPVKVVSGQFGRRAPDGLANDLRRLADQVDRGEVKELVAMWVDEPTSSYTYLWGANPFNSLGMSDMLHAQAMSRMREP